MKTYIFFECESEHRFKIHLAKDTNQVSNIARRTCLLRQVPHFFSDVPITARFFELCLELSRGMAANVRIELMNKFYVQICLMENTC